MRVFVTAVLALTCQLAYAEAPGETPEVTPPGLAPTVAPTPAKPALKSYRAQTLLADGIAVGLMVVAFDTDNSDTAEALAKLSIGTYAFGAPLVHLTKERSGRALASLTMRIGFPIIGGFLGDSLRAKSNCDPYYDYCGDDEGPSGELVLGVLAGIVAASAVDAAYLARGETPKPAEPSWTPTARATQNGFALGVSGSF
ncbi:MAG TPA: hypothetical protein VIV40_11590 [Kofleriaceae bacterium]